MTRTALLINRACLKRDGQRDEIITAIADASGSSPQIIEGTAEDMSEMLGKLESIPCDVLSAYGGDGTANSVAQIARQRDIPFVPLPGGTMNMLHKYIFGTDDLETCISRAFTNARPFFIPGGIVNDRIFLVAALFGEPVSMADAREEARDLNAAKAIEKFKGAVKTVTEEDHLLRYNVDGYAVSKVKSIMVSIPNDGREGFDCTGVDPLSNVDMFKMGLQALGGDWRMNEKVHLNFVEHEVQVKAATRIDCLLDGEKLDVGRDVSLRFEPKCVKVLGNTRRSSL